MAWAIASGTLPIAILGLSFREFIETEARIIGTYRNFTHNSCDWSYDSRTRGAKK